VACESSISRLKAAAASRDENYRKDDRMQSLRIRNEIESRRFRNVVVDLSALAGDGDALPERNPSKRLRYSAPIRSLSGAPIPR
jgi:hypothetical protein